MLRLALLVTALLGARVAHADEPEAGYGYQIGIVDAAPLLLLPAYEVAPGPPYLAIGLGMYAVGGPIVHLAHRHYRRAGASLGLRVGLPIAGLLLGDLLHQAFEPGDVHVWEPFDGPPALSWVLGGMAGFGCAYAIDIGVLARGDRPRGTTVTPTASAGAGRFTVGVAASF